MLINYCAKLRFFVHKTSFAFNPLPKLGFFKELSALCLIYSHPIRKNGDHPLMGTSRQNPNP